MQGFGDNFTLVIPVEDDTLHTPENPFCWDSTCPCHEDQENIQAVAQQVQDGLLTPSSLSERGPYPLSVMVYF
jgi:hypothetical protein